MDKKKVCVKRCSGYDKEKIKTLLCTVLKELGIKNGFFKSKKIVLKPNLLSDNPPEKAVTTHPVFIEAVIDLLLEKGARKDDMVIADSPGIVVQYNQKGLQKTYAKTGLLEVSEKTGVALNYDTGMRLTPVKDGKVVKNLEIIEPVLEADILINLPKFKTHNPGR